MKIALVSPYDWSYPGGVCNHIAHLAAALRRRGHTVRILTPASGSQGRDKEYGIYKFSWVAPIHLNGSVARVAVTPAITGRLNRIMQREQFDVVHVHEPMVSTLTLTALRVARDRGIACVATFHASSNKRASTARWAYAMASPFLHASFQRFDGCIAVSEAAREHVARFFPTDYTIIPNGIDITQFAEATPFPVFQDGKRNVLFFGRMEPRKGLRFLLKAIPLVREHYQGKPVRFILVGEGPQREKFAKVVQRRGWQDVVFTGYVDDAAKLRYFAGADVYCAPNTGNESQGIVLLEAMAAGAPVVASDIPGFRGVITAPAMGLLAPPRNAERLAWAICHILRDDALRASLAANGRARARDYSWEAIAGDIEQVYFESVARSAERVAIHRLRLRFTRLRRSMQAAREAVVGVLDTSG